MPGSGGVAHRTPVDLPTKRLLAAPLGLIFAVAALLAWLLFAPRTPDLAAAAYRLDVFEHLGLALYDEHWYAGHDMPGYSVLFPPLAWLLGLRAVGAIAVLVSVRCFEALTLPRYGGAARWASVAFALAAVGDVWIGRLAFALGLSFALAAVLALTRARRWLALPLAVAAAAASPVAAVLLALAALTDALSRRTPRALLALALPALLVAGALALLFPEGGTEPYPIVSFAATALVTIAFALALPAEQRQLRLGAWLYLLACLACLLISTPVGSNVERYGVLLAGPLLLCAAFAQPRKADPRARGLALLALVGWAVWAGWGPVRETLAVAGDPSTSSAYYAPVERFLDQHAGTPVRLEVPLTRTHWETAELAPRVSLARGWEKQLDERYDSVLLSHQLSAASYHRWLRQQAVAYVALPDVQLDPSSAREGQLIRAGLPYLRLVYASQHWQIYAVRAPTPLATGPGRLTSLGHESFALSVDAPGAFLVRVRYTPYWTIAASAGCVERAAGGWTEVIARRAGPLHVRAEFSLDRALSSGQRCAVTHARG